jgi:transcriptional regulator with XRE-family HTH domain
MNIKSLREEKGVSLSTAAKDLETDPGNLSRIERGKQSPGVPLAKRMAVYYGTTLDALFQSKTAS